MFTSRRVEKIWNHKNEEEKELMAEMIKITGHAVEEGAQEFCEA